MNKNVERLYNGLIKENPTFVLMLGMCPTLAVTSSAINGLGMGLSTTVVLVLSNMLISAFRKVIPDGVRMPAYIVIVASLVTVVQFIMQAYTPSLSESLGVYIPLIVVNCIILGRAESYASTLPFLFSLHILRRLFLYSYYSPIDRLVRNHWTLRLDNEASLLCTSVAGLPIVVPFENHLLPEPILLRNIPYGGLPKPLSSIEHHLHR